MIAKSLSQGESTVQRRGYPTKINTILHASRLAKEVTLERSSTGNWVATILGYSPHVVDEAINDLCNQDSYKGLDIARQHTNTEGTFVRIRGQVADEDQFEHDFEICLETAEVF